MICLKNVLVICCLLVPAWGTKKNEGDGAIRVVMRGPPLPLLLESLSGMLMNQYLKSIPQTGPINNVQSRSDYRQHYGYDGEGLYTGNGGGYTGNDDTNSGRNAGNDGTNSGRNAGNAGNDGFNRGREYDNYNPNRAGYNLGLGLGSLKGFFVGTGSRNFERLSNSGGGYGYGGRGGSYANGDYRSVIPKFNIRDGLMLLKGLIKGTKASRLDGYQLGKQVGNLQGEIMDTAGGVKNFIKSALDDGNNPQTQQYRQRGGYQANFYRKTY